MTKITQAVAEKVLALVDAGLVRGQGYPEPGKMCVEAAVCFALGLPHGDDPKCVARSLRQLKIKLNDSNWSSNEARAKGLRRLAVAQLGSVGILEEKEFVKKCAELAIRVSVPIALRAAAMIQKDSHKAAALRDAADLCEKEPTKKSALKARDAAADAAAAAAADAAADAAAAAAYAAAAAAADAAAAAYAAYAAYAAAAAAAYAAAAAAAAAADAADADAADAAAAAAADAAADADAAYAAYAAAAAADAAAAAARDNVLSIFCEGVVQILIEMKAPGCQWLFLTEQDRE